MRQPQQRVIAASRRRHSSPPIRSICRRISARSCIARWCSPAGGDRAAPYMAEHDRSYPRRRMGGASCARSIRPSVSASSPRRRQRPVSAPSSPSRVDILGIAIGSRIPASVPLYAMPVAASTAAPSIAGYHYALIGDRVYLVDPRDGIVIGDAVSVMEAIMLSRQSRLRDARPPRDGSVLARRSVRARRLRRQVQPAPVRTNSTTGAASTDVPNPPVVVHIPSGERRGEIQCDRGCRRQEADHGACACAHRRAAPVHLGQRCRQGPGVRPAGFQAGGRGADAEIRHAAGPAGRRSPRRFRGSSRTNMRWSRTRSCWSIRSTAYIVLSESFESVEWQAR